MILQIRLVTLFTFLMLMVLGVLFRSTLLPQANRVVAQWLELPSGSSPPPVQAEKAPVHAEPAAPALPRERTVSPVEKAAAPLDGEGKKQEAEPDHQAGEGTATSVSSERDAALPDPALPAEGRYAAEDPVPAPLIAPRPLRGITRGEIDTILRKRREAEAALDAVHRESGWQ